jgi:hypothetical protein
MHDALLHLQQAVHKSSFKPSQAFAPLVQIVNQLQPSEAQKEINRVVKYQEQVLLRQKTIITQKEDKDKFLAGFRLIPIYISLKANPNQSEKLLECLQLLKIIVGAFPGLPSIAASVRSLKPKT